MPSATFLFIIGFFYTHLYLLSLLVILWQNHVAQRFRPLEAGRSWRRDFRIA